MSKEKITITKSEYEQLVDDAKFLSALNRAGVDSWPGYGMAYDIYEDMKEEE